MRKSFSRYPKYALGLFVFIFALSLIYWVGDGILHKQGGVEAKITEETIAFDKDNPQIKKVIAIQNRHTPKLMAIPEVVGTATGLNEAGGPTILVFTKKQVKAGVIPGRLEGTPVVVKVVGKFFSMKPPKGTGGKPSVPTARLERPVPIGVSTGNIGECSAGTIGARVKDASGNVYALSNNHVYALENTASRGSEVLQPGRYEGYDRKTNDCPANANDAIGTLADFEEIDFHPLPPYYNNIDAAIALSSIDNLGNSTPENGYGTPGSSPVDAVIGQAVQKYGRTTSLTKGTITGVNATVLVQYGLLLARFEDQIIVESNKSFIKAGDSGSLLVTDDSDCSPVGLLFAGDTTGKYAIANPIGLVLSRFGVEIDGK
jgi:hypothetical protein